MDQDKTEPKPQSLLEAAKAIDRYFGTASLYAGSDVLQNLNDAIYREESRPPNAEELALAEVAKARWQFSIPDGQTVVQALWALRKGKEQAEAELANVHEALKAAPFEGDPKACAFKSHAQFYGESPYQTAKDASEAVDPCTGWTFATYRRVVEALGGKS